MFCAPVLVFGDVECVGSRFQVLRARTRFRLFPGRRVPFSHFARPNSFSVVPRASGPVLMFCAPRLIFGGTEVVGSRFPILRTRTRFSTVSRASGNFFMFCSLGHILGGTEGVGSCFHVLRARTRFRRYRACRVPFSSFAPPNSFSAIPRASSTVFMFCAPGLIFGDTEGVGSLFDVLLARTRFRLYRGRRDPFSFLHSRSRFQRCLVRRSQTHFRRNRGRPVPFSCFARSY
jgi:hypothetical protein